MENLVKLVQSVATQPVYVAEQEEIFKRRYRGMADHLFTTDEMRMGTIFTDGGVEALGIVSSGGMYTNVSDSTGLYSFDPAVIGKLSEEGYEWTPFYSGRRRVNLSDVALYNNMIMSGKCLELNGPCRIITTNMEIDQFVGIYEVRFRITGLEVDSKDPIATLEVLGEVGERVIAREDVLKSDFDKTGVCNKVVKYSIGNTPKISYAINVADGSRIVIDEITWQGASVNASAGVELFVDGRVEMKTNDKENLFNKIQLQIFDKAGNYVCTLEDQKGTGRISGDYTHIYNSGLFCFRLKGNANLSDEWIRVQFYINKGDIIHYDYDISKFTADHIVFRHIQVNNRTILSY